jgi:hypothetical protein
MTLSAGTRLGPYEIVSAVGAGSPPPLALITVASFGEACRSPERIWS